MVLEPRSTMLNISPNKNPPFEKLSFSYTLFLIESHTFTKDLRKDLRMLCISVSPRGLLQCLDSAPRLDYWLLQLWHLGQNHAITNVRGLTRRQDSHRRGSGPLIGEYVLKAGNMFRK